MDIWLHSKLPSSHRIAARVNAVTSPIPVVLAPSLSVTKSASNPSTVPPSAVPPSTVPFQRASDVDLSEVSSVEDDEEIRRDLDDLDVEGSVEGIVDSVGNVGPAERQIGNDINGVAGECHHVSLFSFLPTAYVGGGLVGTRFATAKAYLVRSYLRITETFPFVLKQSDEIRCKCGDRMLRFACV